MSATVGYGIGGAIGVGTESTYGTGVAPSLWIPFLSESIQATRPVVEAGTITGDRSTYRNLPGVRSAQGDITMEFDGSTLGQLLFYANGNASGGLNSIDIPGRFSAAPGATPASGGSLSAGDYRYRAAAVWARTDSGEFFVLPASASVTATAGSGDLTIDLTWTDPTSLTPPSGFTYAGTAIYRSPVDGGENSERFLAYVSGTGTSYSDTGAVALGTQHFLTGAMRQHTFSRAFTIGQNPLPGFSTVVAKDNDASQRFLGCRMNQATLTWGAGDSPVQAQFQLMARDFEEVANPTPSISNLRKGMAWQATVGIDGVFNETVEGLSVVLANNCELVPGLSGRPRQRDVGYGRRSVSGTLSRSFQDHGFWRKMREAERFAIRCLTTAGPISETVGSIPVGGGAVAWPIPYFMSVDVYGCMLDQAGANIGGPGRMVEQINFRSEVDSGEGTELRIRLYNLTASYS